MKALHHCSVPPPRCIDLSLQGNKHPNVMAPNLVGVACKLQQHWQGRELGEPGWARPWVQGGMLCHNSVGSWQHWGQVQVEAAHVQHTGRGVCKAFGI